MRLALTKDWRRLGPHPAFADGAEGHAVFQVGAEDRQQQQRQKPGEVNTALVGVPELGRDHHRRRQTQLLEKLGYLLRFVLIHFTAKRIYGKSSHSSYNNIILCVILFALAAEYKPRSTIIAWQEA